MNTQVKTYKYILLLLSAILFSSGSLFAQSQQKRNHPPKLPSKVEITKIVKELSEDISLSSEQKNEVSTLFNSHFDEAKTKMKEHETTHKMNRAEMDKLRNNFEIRIKSLLNDEQKIGFDNFMKNHKHESKQQKPRR